MGKVISTFQKGWPGAISRSVDDIVVSLMNGGSDNIEYGAPVFLTADCKGVENFRNSSAGGTPQDFEKFVGFAVRAAGKTPDTYPSGQDMETAAGNQKSSWKPGEAVDVLVRGTIVVSAASGFLRGGKVYIRKTDGKLVPTAGQEGTTVLLENVRIRTAQTGQSSCAEAVVTYRHIQ